MVAIIFTLIGMGIAKLIQRFQTDEDIILRAFIANEDSSDVKRSFNLTIKEHVRKLDSLFRHAKSEAVSADSLRQLLKESWAILIQTDRLLYNEEINYHYDSLMFSMILSDEKRRTRK